MKNLRKICNTVLILIMLSLLSTSFPNVTEGKTAHAATIKISRSKANLRIGETVILKISGTKSAVTWTTSNKKVAIVNKDGYVEAKKAGKATITGTVNKKKYTCAVTVSTKKIKEPKFTVSSVGGQEPNKIVVVYVTIKNKGTETMNIYNYDPIILDEQDERNNRYLYLMDADYFDYSGKIQEVDYVDIEPDETKEIYFIVEGESTVFNEDSWLYFDFWYDDVAYLCYCNENNNAKYYQENY